MIGVDAGDLNFIQAHLHRLPNLRTALEQGPLHRLRSTAGLLTGSVWPTFYTGTSPGEHGIHHHLQWDSQSMHLRRVTADWLYCEPFWYELERRGLEVAAIDVPLTFPSRLQRGVEVISWGSHDALCPFTTHPRQLAFEIRRLFGQHPMGSEIPVEKTPGQLERIRRNLVAGARRKSELTRSLLAQRDWDFFLTVFGETHRGGHILWPESGDESDSAFQALLEVYEAVDRSVGEVLSALSKAPTIVVLFALHGMGRNTSQEHFLPKIMDRLNAQFTRKGATSADRRAAGKQRSLVRLLRETVPARLQNAVAQAVPVGVRDAVVDRQITAGRDWSGTPGLALLADLHGYLRWNICGREKEGMLDAGSVRLKEYQDWIHRGLYELRISDTGNPLVRDILQARDVFPGRRTAQLPDAIVTWTGAPPASRLHSDTIGDLSAELASGRGGNHRPEGFCVVIRRGTEAGEQWRPAHIGELAGMVSGHLLQGS